MKKVIISVLGRDRPGILAAVSNNLFLQNCNIENVSQTSLQSEFAGIFIVSKPQDLLTDDLRSRLAEALAPMDLHAHVKDLDSKEPYGAAIRTEPFVITTLGPDRKGLVAGISEVLARYNVNVTNLQAVFKGGENPKDNHMIYEVDVPTEIDPQALFGELKAAVNRLGLDISIQHRKIFETINRV